MSHVDVFDSDHSPWVQAVLLSLYEAKIDHRLRSIPPLLTLLKTGLMIAAFPVTAPLIIFLSVRNPMK